MQTETRTDEQGPVYWSVFEDFDFLLNVMASTKEEATVLALTQLGWNADKGPHLSVFVAVGDTVTTLAARNTFGLFQEHGGVAFDWHDGETRAISRDDCESMLERMRLWLDQPEASWLAEGVGSDLDYVRAQIADIEGLLSNPRWSCFPWVVFQPFHDDDREAAEDAARADAYCDALYTSSPED